jgi:hypothetical protein
VSRSHARAVETSMHTSATASRSTTIFGFFMTISSSLVVTDPVMETIDDLGFLDIRDSVPVITETFHVVPEDLIMLLLDCL